MHRKIVRLSVQKVLQLILSTLELVAQDKERCATGYPLSDPEQLASWGGVSEIRLTILTSQEPIVLFGLVVFVFRQMLTE